MASSIAANAANAAKFVGSVGQFGNRMSSIIHDFAIVDNPYSDELDKFRASLDALVHSLNQVGKLLDQQGTPDTPTDDGKSRALFAQDGVDYVIALTEECSVSLCRGRSIIMDGVDRGRATRDWPSFTTVDEKGQRTFNAPNLDEVDLFRKLDSISWSRGRTSSAMWDVVTRLEDLQLLLFLVISVVTVREMMIKTPSGGMDLKNLVQYHKRVERAADLSNVTKPDRRRRRPCSSDYSSYSDSDDSERIIRRRKPRKPLPLKRPPPPPPAWIGRPPQPPPPMISTPMGPPPLPHGNGSRIVDLSCNPNSAQPPAYIDIPTANVDGSTTTADKSNRESIGMNSTSSTFSGTTAVSEKGAKIEEKDKAAKIEAEKVIKQPAVNQARLLNGPTGLGMKIKSFFRSKSALEAEMKRVLADDNASLTAFIIQGGEYFQVPHSAFHSLEYTHMRTILSQLQDNTWFKTFSELRESEHDALESVGCRIREKDKLMKRELVVLKVLQENRLNAYVRLLENCMGLDEVLPQHENGRIVLAIMREIEFTDDELKTPGKTVIQPGPKVVNSVYNIQRNFHPVGIRDGPPPMGPQFARDPGMVNRPAAVWNGPDGPPVAGPTVFTPHTSNVHSDVTPRAPQNEATAREALTTYKSFTFRPLRPQISPTDGRPPLGVTWSRCSITQEHDTKAVLQDCIAAFNRRGDSVIDLKMQLTEPQSAQISRLIDDVQRYDYDRDFEHKLVEISLMDHQNGSVRRQTIGIHVDVMHIVLQRSPKENVNALSIHRMNGPIPMRSMPRPGPPPHMVPPPPAREGIVMIESFKSKTKGKSYVGRRRSVSPSTIYSTSSDSSNSDSDSDSDSDSTMMTDSTVSSFGGRRRKVTKGKKKAVSSDSDDEDDKKPRWKKDPTLVKLTKKERKMDVVLLLLDRWTPAGEGKPKAEEKTEDEKKSDKKNKGKNSKKDRRRRKM